jgi:glycosyltransferase involved in cell wall biosynthesis
VETLFQALSQAMERDPRIVFMSVGAGVKLTQNDRYERLLAKIEASPFRQRFHMLGWRPANEVPDYYRQADVGLNLDTFHYETLLGTRTRLVEMMRHGLPVITSLGCELSSLIHTQGLGFTFPIGDADTLCTHILKLANDPVVRQATAERARAYVSQQLSFSETTRPFRAWAHRPYHAPDRLGGSSHYDLREVEFFLRSVMRTLLWDFWALERGE